MNMNMKKTAATLLTTILMSQLSQAHVLTEGNYTGNGRWRSAQEAGTYKITSTVEKNALKTKYELTDGSFKEWNFQINDTTNGFFEVISQGIKLGSGYCLDKVNVCHYQFTVGQLSLEETIVQDGNKIYRFGSKDEGHGLISWQENLSLEQIKE